jgi:hypothetical protein
LAKAETLRAITVDGANLRLSEGSRTYSKKLNKRHYEKFKKTNSYV